MARKTFVTLTAFATVLALTVVVLGAFVRLSDAGLGCPDWPGCYGRAVVPSAATAVQVANEAYPGRPVEAHKAWKEMVHRYFAGTLGMLIALIAVSAWRRRRDPRQNVVLPTALVGLVIFQALLGMWTVTLMLKPVVVMGHLLGGLSTLGLLWWLTLRESDALRPALASAAQLGRLRTWATLGLVVLAVQIALGGWTSANYAALQCPDFPTCQGHWWPAMDFRDAFTLWRGTGINYEGGVLGNSARMAIHVTHRIGALVTFLVLAWVAVRSIRATRDPLVRGVAAVLLAVLGTQVALGISNVLFGLPLPVAVAHNGVAALLLLTVISLNHVLRPIRREVL